MYDSVLSPGVKNPKQLAHILKSSYSSNSFMICIQTCTPTISAHLEVVLTGLDGFVEHTANKGTTDLLGTSSDSVQACVAE